MTRRRPLWSAAAQVVAWVPRISVALGLAYGVLWYLSPHRFGDYLRNPRATDFALYYRDARAGLEFGWSHMYDLQAFERATREVLPVSRDSPTLVSLSIPLLTWLAAPFALLPLNTGYLLWLLLMALCLGGTFWLLAPRRPLHAAAWLLFAPLALTFALGQSAALVAISVAAAARLLRAGREWPAGLALGLALVKPQLVVLLPFCLLAAGRWRALTGWIAIGAAIAAVTLAVVGVPAAVDYVHRVLSVSGTPATLQVISDAAPVSALPSWTLKALVIAAVAAACAALAWLERRSSDRVLAVALVGSLLAAPYLHYQDLLLLVLAGWLVLAAEPTRWERWLLGIGYLQAALAISVLPALEACWLVARLAVGLRRPDRPPVAADTQDAEEEAGEDRLHTQRH